MKGVIVCIVKGRQDVFLQFSVAAETWFGDHKRVSHFQDHNPFSSDGMHFKQNCEGGKCFCLHAADLKYIKRYANTRVLYITPVTFVHGDVSGVSFLID